MFLLSIAHASDPGTVDAVPRNSYARYFERSVYAVEYGRRLLVEKEIELVSMRQIRELMKENRLQRKV